MKRSLPGVSSVPTLLLDGEVSPAATPTPTSVSMPEIVERPRKLRRQGSRVMSVLRSLTNSSNSIKELTTWPAPSPTPSEQSPNRRRLFRKMSLPFLRAPFGGTVTVIHRIRTKSRPSIRSMERAADEPLLASAPAILSPSISNSNSNSNGNSNTNSSGKSSGPTNGTGTTAKTSFDSKLSSKDNNSVDKRPASIVHRKEPEAVSAVKDSNLTTIQEATIDPPTPTILTVERAAAAKIYLETYFHEKLNKPSPRSLRRRYLESELYHNLGLSPAEINMRRTLFYRQETNHLRETRALVAKSMVNMKGQHDELVDGYEVLKILGKGSFGVVRLVRKKLRSDDGPIVGGRVYAMKVIRKSAMLRTSQEGHLRAERDFLVAAEGSRWIVPLIASFQDAANLYLVMDYMPGGDFLGLLIRENILSEPVAKFYIAEMILCIEEAHSLRCIHRDIKPDNFLISTSGHLKISDFGLAFDGHWSHDTSYYHTQRYSLLHKLGLSVAGDADDRAEGLQGTMKWAQGVTQAMQKHERQPPPFNTSPAFRDEPLLNWRNRCSNRSAARSCVGTSQYMAPESLGVILYECLYGHTPFLSEEGGRQQTKRNIVNHKQTFAFPPRPVVSRRCMDLVASLVCAKEYRLSSKRYRYRDTSLGLAVVPSKNRTRIRNQDWKGRSVYPHDAEDIKSHKWFRDIPWEQLHGITPPFVPQITTLEDTHYFDEEEPISDWSESCADETDSETETLEANPLANSVAMDAANPNLLAPSTAGNHKPHPSTTIRRSPQKMAAMQAQLAAFPRHTRTMLAQFVAAPYDSSRLKRMDREIDALASGAVSTSAQPSGTMPHQNIVHADQMKAFIRAFGRRERKRPRDRLLRDRNTKATVLEVRKQTAFLGYAFRGITNVGTTAGITTFHGEEGGLFRAVGRDRIPGVRERVEGEVRGVRPNDAVGIAAYGALHQGRGSMGW
ncbi:kinase-like domain-containing protein [Xylariaceae sp. FL1651]|nr:kinase-like domain-containing protein [Xylariaceae sp. FL1651]